MSLEKHEYHFPLLAGLITFILYVCRYSKREKWRVHGKISSYYKHICNLRVAMVRNTGHLLTVDKPEWVKEMVHWFTFNNTANPISC